MNYIPEDILIKERRVIPFNELKRIEKQLNTIYKIFKRKRNFTGFSFKTFNFIYLDETGWMENKIENEKHYINW